jgi:hypothetical protein
MLAVPGQAAAGGTEPRVLPAWREQRSALLAGPGISHPVADIQSGDLIAALDDASLSRFHLRAVVASGMGFFTDAYDLFVIGIASTLIDKDWHLSSGQLAVLNSTMLAAACLGALVFGRFADVVGRSGCTGWSP